MKWFRAMVAVSVVSGCALDTEEPAPYMAPASQVGACGSTESLLPKLFEFVREDRFLGFRTFIERHLILSDENPAPEFTVRTLVGAAVHLIHAIGLDETSTVAEVVRSNTALKHVTPLLMTTLRFSAGDLDAHPHYEGVDALGHFIRACDADHLLSAVEVLVRFRSPSHDNLLWLNAVTDQLSELVRDPLFEPFLETFERESEKGRPAIVALTAQLMALLTREDFDISLIETLLESLVYPIVDESLRLKLEDLVGLIEEVTHDRDAVLRPLQRAMRCGMNYPAERDSVVGYFYDLVVSEEVGIVSVLETVDQLVSVDDSEQLLGMIARLSEYGRADQKSLNEILALMAAMLEQPDVEVLLPVIIDLIDAGVLSEFLSAIIKLLEGCGRA